MQCPPRDGRKVDRRLDADAVKLDFLLTLNTLLQLPKTFTAKTFSAFVETGFYGLWFCCCAPEQTQSTFNFSFCTMQCKATHAAFTLKEAMHSAISAFANTETEHKEVKSSGSSRGGLQRFLWLAMIIRKNFYRAACVCVWLTAHFGKARVLWLSGYGPVQLSVCVYRN